MWLRGVAGHVVLLLGAFDPPTRAHVELLAGAARARGRAAAACMTKVLLDRPADALLEPTERLSLLERLGERHGFGLAACNRGTYLEVARAAAAAGIDAEFLVGSDKLPQLADPRFYPDGERGVEATFAEVRFLVVPRGVTVDREDVNVLDVASLFTDPEVAGISASAVRERIGRGEDIVGLVPDIVAEAVEGYTGGTNRGER